MLFHCKPTLTLLFIFAVHILSAQDSLQATTSASGKRIRITPLPVIYYSPETRFGFGALLAANFETVKIQDGITRSSYAQTYFLYTMNKQYDWGTSTRVYLPENKSILHVKLNHLFFPEYYYGIETEDPESHKDTIEYNRTSADIRYFLEVKKNFYIGMATRYNRISNVFTGDEGSLNKEQPPGYDGYWLMGFAPALTLETRDSFVYPRKGVFVEALWYVYPSYKNRSYAMRTFRLDVRKYFPLKLISDIDALAFQLLANVNTGDVPFKDMADIGGSETMRGYYRGFYRYKNLYAVQAEYRSLLFWRVGFSAWVGGALTPGKWHRLADHSFKPNAGLGLRVMMNKKDRLNVRIDQGFGKLGQNGLYLDIAEAF